ncbi:cytochrome P450 [Brevibacterium sp. R8603A2]|uniref:cytochrome P450 n=1 Tax=Brevibacterium sp. R8603A2 TaxID=2929779 RepID=UPI000DB75828|nr:cytochrome P450 [Brevibacterium sp. R8603A2]MCK1804266.1 cytochrome P450 [Brevibacterium sp. R8603A2]PZO61193.1 MAG: cytochrome P450 [Pseudoxanthomonas suwonensis]
MPTTDSNAHRQAAVARGSTLAATAERLAHVRKTPLEELDPGSPGAFTDESVFVKFERIRNEDPVHFTSGEHTKMGPYWSLTRWEDIMAADTDPESFSADAGIVMRPASTVDLQGAYADESADDQTDSRTHGEDAAFQIQSLLSMDPPEHDLHRQIVAPAVAPTRLSDLESVIRRRAQKILDDLPIGKEFDWVDLVSKELTAMTLATLLNFPQEHRRKLTYWSDVATAIAGPGQIIETPEERVAILGEFFTTLMELVDTRQHDDPAPDFASLLAHSPHAREFTRAQLFGDLVVLLVGGNDTTRNTITGSLYALNRWPEEFAKLRRGDAKVASMVSETIRWQTPLTHMMRVATKDTELGGKTIRKGDRVALWYLSGNRDSSVIEDPDEFMIDRKNPRRHISFGFGVHRCLGNRLAELQLRIIWEEILVRFPEIRVVEEPVRTYDNFVRGYESMKVLIPRRNTPAEVDLGSESAPADDPEPVDGEAR